MKTTRRTPSHSSAPSSASLIELLVVFSIVIALVGLVLAGAAKVRARGVRAQCQGNLRQIGAAIQMYASDYKGLLPYACTMLYETNANPGGTAPPDGFLQDLLIPYLEGAQGNNARVLICRGVRKDWVLAETNRNDYRYNYKYANGWSIPQQRRALDSVATPTTAVLVLDKAWADWTLDELPHDGINAGYVDGHVSFVDGATFIATGDETNGTGTFFSTGW